MFVARSATTNHGDHGVMVVVAHGRLFSYFVKATRVFKSNKAAMSTVNAVDMSVKVGGRVFQPALPVVDGSFPTDIEQGFQKTLENYTDDNIPIESTQGMKTRERVLIQLEQTCRDWIRYECVRKGLPSEVVSSAAAAASVVGGEDASALFSSSLSPLTFCSGSLL